MAKFWRRWLNMHIVNTRWSVVGSYQAAVGKSMAYKKPEIKNRAVVNFPFRLRNSLHFLEDYGEVVENI